MESKIVDKVNRYYTDKVNEHGATSLGVDWNGPESQELRFEQLSKLMPLEENFSILDYGCGFGSYVDFLNKRQKQEYSYFGFDISEEMLQKANEKFPELRDSFKSKLSELPKVDYVIASGLFNVRLEFSDEEWLEYIKESLRIMDSKCTKGFSFNVLTSYSDAEYMKEYLYYASPMVLFDFCKREFSRNVALLHDYDLYEFSIIVRK